MSQKPKHHQSAIQCDNKARKTESRKMKEAPVRDPEKRGNRMVKVNKHGRERAKANK